MSLFPLQTPSGLCRIDDYFKQLRSENDAFRILPFGKSYAGNRILGAAIGRMKHPVLFAGGFDAQDWFITALLLRFLNDIAESLAGGGILYSSDLPKFFERGGVIVVPCANPDGMEIALQGNLSYQPLQKHVETMSGAGSVWHANAMGVRIQQNFDAQFQPGLQPQRGAEGFPGIRPASEPETKALMRLCGLFPCKRVVSFHCGGETILARRSRSAPQNSGITASLLSSSCGYHLALGEEAYEPGSFKDWFVDRGGAEGYAIKVGRSSVPLTEQDLEPVYTRLIQTLILMMIL